MTLAEILLALAAVTGGVVCVVVAVRMASGVGRLGLLLVLLLAVLVCLGVGFLHDETSGTTSLWNQLSRKE